MRLDQWLYVNQLAKSRSQAEEMITRGEVQIYNHKLGTWFNPLKPSFKVTDPITINDVKIDSPLTRYVSRGGLKLQAAIEKTNWNVRELKILDIGQSTGGFTDCLIQQGVSKIIGLDVGNGQLAQDLKESSKVIFYENLDIRQAPSQADFMAHMPVDGIVIDVSFISLTLVLPAAMGLLRPNGHLLALVKPQFELTKADLDKKGIVKSAEKLLLVKTKITDYVRNQELGHILDYFESAEKGRDGNVEFFIFLKKR